MLIIYLYSTKEVVSHGLSFFFQNYGPKFIFLLFCLFIRGAFKNYVEKFCNIRTGGLFLALLSGRLTSELIG